MLTHLAGTVPIRAIDAIARRLGLTAVIEMFCPHCPSWTDETDDEIEETAA